MSSWLKKEPLNRRELKVMLALQEHKHRLRFERGGEGALDIGEGRWKVPDFEVQIPIPQSENTKLIFIEVESFSTKSQVRSAEMKMPLLRKAYPESPLIIVTTKSKEHIAEGLCDRIVLTGRGLADRLTTALLELAGWTIYESDSGRELLETAWRIAAIKQNTTRITQEDHKEMMPDARR